MKVKEVIEYLSVEKSWVNRDETKDRLLFGEKEAFVSRVMVTWVASLSIIEQAIQEGVELIITHENPFYQASTNPKRVIEEMQKKKIALLTQENIAVFRCHDLWDLYPKIGVRDSFADQIDVVFEPVLENSFYRYAQANNQTMFEIAKKLSDTLSNYGQKTVQVLGDAHQPIKKLGIGTGAVTNVAEMLAQGVDGVVVTDDGVSNWVDIQLAMDKKIPVLIVNHYTSEAKGIENLAIFLTNKFEQLKVDYIPQRYEIQSF